MLCGSGQSWLLRAAVLFKSCKDDMSKEQFLGMGLQADLLKGRQGWKAKAASERQELVGAEGVQDPLEPAPPDSGATPDSNSMLRNLDIRQNISSRATLE